MALSPRIPNDTHFAISAKHAIYKSVMYKCISPAFDSGSAVILMPQDRGEFYVFSANEGGRGEITHFRLLLDWC